MCKDCPHKKGSENKPFSDYVKQVYKDGGLPTIVHRCHKISKDTFDEVDDQNVCVGSQMMMEKLKY